MSEQTIMAPALGGKTIPITGETIGRFLLHDAQSVVVTPDDDLFLGYCITHSATGLKFPWSFRIKRLARKFARDVETIIDWEKVGVTISPGLRAATWTTGKPTDKELRAIYKLAKECGGVRE